MRRENKVTIKIPAELYKKLKFIIRGTGFSSVTEFIVFTMRTIAAGGKVSKKGVYERKEIREIKRRLKALGYI
jgi:hypothetical protein